jgi:hypothetical protein
MDRSRRHRLRTVKHWLSSPSTNADALVTALLGWLVVTAIGVGVGAALSALELVHVGDSVATPLVVAALAATLGLGVLVGAQAALRFRPREPAAAETEGPMTVGTLEAELDRARTEISQLAPDHRTMVMLEAYAEHLGLMLTKVGEDLDEERAFLFEPAKLMEKFISAPVHLLLLEIEVDEHGRPQWEPTRCPTLTPRERADLRVLIGRSWIAHTQRQQRQGEVFSLGDVGDLVRKDLARGADLSAFLRHDFHALSCCSLFADREPGQNGPCLVMLARKPNAFSRHQKRQFQLVAGMLGVHLRIRSLEGGIAP